MVLAVSTGSETTFFLNNISSFCWIDSLSSGCITSSRCCNIKSSVSYWEIKAISVSPILKKAGIIKQVKVYVLVISRKH